MEWWVGFIPTTPVTASARCHKKPNLFWSQEEHGVVGGVYTHHPGDCIREMPQETQPTCTFAIYLN
jgi:hypothetical protein